jgi:hypothetical protein
MWTKPLSRSLTLIFVMCSLTVLAGYAVASAPGDSPDDAKIENTR